jgi:hypothetical protein
MTSPFKMTANRANAQSSTGPKQRMAKSVPHEKRDAMV